MSDPRFVQIHWLTSYPASLLNRDDVGFAKRIPFGDAVRTRVSSQCLKRHWRTFEGDGSLHDLDDVEMSVRSRRTFDTYIRAPLEAAAVGSALAQALTAELMTVVLGQSPKKAKANEDSGEAPSLESGQVTVLGPAELRYLLEEAKSMAEGADSSLDSKKADKLAKKLVKDRNKKEWKKNLDGMRRAAGLDAALFGRMVTSDLLAQTDAAIHVAHAFTVHPQLAESDYFSAIDDLVKDSGEAGSGHIGSVELTSGLFYGYVVVDLPLLVSNLEGCARAEWSGADRGLAGQVVSRLLQLIATVSPGAKLGSTAPYSFAHFLGAELGSAQPRTLANAFLHAIPAKGDLIASAYERLAAQLVDLDQMYGKAGERRMAAMGSRADLESAFDATVSLADLGTWLASQIQGQG